MSPLQFGIMIVLNLSIGLCSPPVGAVLFITCAIAKTRLDKIIRPLLPLYVAMFVVLMLITYVAWFSEALPAPLFGGIKPRLLVWKSTNNPKVLRVA